MSNVEDSWKVLLPLVAAICAGAQDEFDPKQAVEEAGEIIEACQDYIELAEARERKAK